MRRRVHSASALVAAMAMLQSVSTLPAGAASARPGVAGTTVVAVEISTYGLVLEVGGASGPGRLGGYPLYENSADTASSFACGTRRVPAVDIANQDVVPLSCTGPGSDMVDGVGSDDWPALTTTVAPIAGPGVDPHLLGSVYRQGIGRQVTYAGHPLYMDHSDAPPSDGYPPFGEGFLETVLPMPPWHVLWDLVTASNGLPDPGPATIETEALPDGKRVLAVAEFPTGIGGAVTVYSYSLDHPGHSACTGECAVEWVPVLTSGAVRAATGVAGKDLGTLQRADREEQVTYEGKPLYLYSREKFVFPPPVSLPQTTGTAGNGDGLRWPGGVPFPSFRSTGPAEKPSPGSDKRPMEETNQTICLGPCRAHRWGRPPRWQSCRPKRLGFWLAWWGASGFSGLE
jgi:hypothetical protein